MARLLWSFQGSLSVTKGSRARYYSGKPLLTLGSFLRRSAAAPVAAGHNAAPSHSGQRILARVVSAAGAGLRGKIGGHAAGAAASAGADRNGAAARVVAAAAAGKHGRRLVAGHSAA